MKSKKRSEPRPVTVTLHWPVTVDGATVSSLTMRAPRARDSRDAQRGAAGPADTEIRLLANLCEVAPEAIEELHGVDYIRLQEALAGFFSPPAQ